jgi:hypothetical protein
MHKSTQLAVAFLLLSSTTAYAGPGLGADAARAFSLEPRASIARTPAFARIPASAQPSPRTATLPSPRTAAMTRTATVEPSRTVALDQPRLPRSFQEPAASAPETSRNMEESSAVAFPIQWRAHSALVSPSELVSGARNFRRTGLPIVHLWQSNNTHDHVALGLSPRGVPGVYFTQKISN